MRHLSLLLLLSLALPLSASAAEPAKRPANMVTVNIEDVMRQFKIQEPKKNLVAVTADQQSNTVALFFRDAQNHFKLYKNAELLLRGTQPIPADPIVFRFVEGSQLLHAVNPTALYLDDKRLSSNQNRHNYYTATHSAEDHAGRIFFPETHSIREYDLASGQTKTLHTHKGTIVQLRLHGEDIFYTVQEGFLTYYLYLNGRKLFDIPVDNPANFAITQNGKVLFFARNGDGYTLYQDDFPYASHRGESGFIFVDPSGAVWHSGFESLSSGTGSSSLYWYDVSVYRNKENVTDALGNMEGSMDFQGKHYAFRASKKTDPNILQLFKDGKFVGVPFEFLGKRDFHGVQFDARGITYMRNWHRGRWTMFADGRPVLQKDFRNVWYFNLDGEKVRVYGSKF